MSIQFRYCRRLFFMVKYIWFILTGLMGSEAKKGFSDTQNPAT